MKELKIEDYYDHDRIHNSNIKISKYMRLLYRGISTVCCEKSALCKVTQQTRGEFRANGAGHNTFVGNMAKEHQEPIKNSSSFTHLMFKKYIK